MTRLSPIRLGVNIDHIATLRNARGGLHPDPVRGAEAALDAGADGITAHLREDRRHIRDDDMERLEALCAQRKVPLNMEIAATGEMVEIACALRPHAICLVPERRSERTTEGGLDVAGQHNHLAPIIRRLSENGSRVSLFIEADSAQIEMAAYLRTPVIEIHTGAYAHALDEGDNTRAATCLEQIKAGAELAHDLGLEVHAGHGLTFDNVAPIATISQIRELNIGHFLIGEALFVGLDKAIAAMKALMDGARA